MKKLILLASLGSVSFLAADQYGYNSNSCADCDRGSGYYQGNRSQNYSQDQQYYQGNRNPSYSQDQQYQSNRNQNYSQDQQYQGNRNPSYQDQQYQGNRNQNYSQDNAGYRDSSYSQNNDTKVLSDQEITDKIRDTVGSGWFSKGYQNVSYVVRNGNVSLRGSVETIDDKKNVEDAVRKIQGVRSVDSQVVVAKADMNKNTSTDSRNGYSDSNRNAYSDSNRNTYADSSQNTYADSSKNAYTEEQLADSEKKYPQDSAATKEDKQLNARIRDKVSNGWFTQAYKTIALRTNNGVVTLTGAVDKRDDMQKIIDQIQGIEGVRSVNSQLTVRNP